MGFGGGIDHAAVFFKSRVCSLAGNAEGCSEETSSLARLSSRMSLS